MNEDSVDLTPMIVIMSLQGAVERRIERQRAKREWEARR